MSRGRNGRDQVKVVIINTEYIETGARSFKSVVQKLTGKEAAAAPVQNSGVTMSKFKSNNPSPNLGRGMSFKLDNLLKLELPSFDNLFTLYAEEDRSNMFLT
uniref:VQ motif-containing protein 10 n=1 Tax=Nicotiana tabacum TaxID=4097 RepID=A0A1S3YVK0_TOBAC|nr:PREDICTED: VQ motif-containing protein 10-like [Nicotiana tabacum]